VGVIDDGVATAAGVFASFPESFLALQGQTVRSDHVFNLIYNLL
jgi:hypothetical protein